MFVGFVDESKSKDYILVMTLILPKDLRDARQQLKKLRRPGQTRLHFSKEKDGRRREIVTHLASMRFETHFYVTSQKHQASARAECLTDLVENLAELRVHRLVIERDHSYEDSDKKLIRENLLRLGSLQRRRLAKSCGSDLKRKTWIDHRPEGFQVHFNKLVQVALLR